MDKTLEEKKKIYYNERQKIYAIKAKKWKECEDRYQKEYNLYNETRDKIRNNSFKLLDEIEKEYENNIKYCKDIFDHIDEEYKSDYTNDEISTIECGDLQQYFIKTEKYRECNYKKWNILRNMISCIVGRCKDNEQRDKTLKYMDMFGDCMSNATRYGV